MINRRNLLLSGLQLGAYTALPKLTAGQAAAYRTEGTQPLKALGSACGMKIGVQAERKELEDPAFAQFVRKNFNLMTPGNELKWTALRPSPDSYSFERGDWMVDFGLTNDILIHGHNLCWNSSANPKWFPDVLTKDNARKYLSDHITTVMTHYRGKIDSWDVVNEPIVPWSKREDLLYPGVWLSLLGPEYIDIAFHAAAAADPKPLRVLNLHHIEHDVDDDERTRQGAVRLLTQLVKRGVPIQAIGMESHMDASLPYGGQHFARFADQVRNLGLQILITELEVNDTSVNGDNRSRDQAVAKYYYDYLTEVMPAGRMNTVIFWTPSDKWSWLNSSKDARFHRADGKAHRSGLLDENLNAKPAVQAVGMALQKICAEQGRSRT